LSNLSSLSGLFAAASPTAAPTATITPGATVPNVGPIDQTAANAGIYAQAKDTAGQQGRASLESLRGLLGESGGLGSGAEAQGTRDIVENAAGQVGQVNRDLAATNAKTSLTTALANQQAGVTERGQDIQAQEAQARLAQEQAQLQFDNAMAQQNRQLELLKLALGMGSSLTTGGLVS
jgi:hypothetical protein